MHSLLFWVALFCAAATPAHAGPVIAAVGAVFSALGSLGVFGQLVLSVALKVGTSLLSRALGKKNQPEVAGVRGQMQVGGDNPLSFIVGTYATAGQLEYVNTWGQDGKTPNAYLTMVFSLSDLPIAGLSSTVWINGEKCTIDFGAPTVMGHPVLEYRKGVHDLLWIKVYDGTQTAPDPFLMGRFSGDPSRPWRGDQIGQGVAYVIVTARLNREMLNKPPQCRFVVNGSKWYDPRKDSSVGGSGPHRWGDFSTYEWSENPKVVGYNILRGVYYGSAWLYGGQNMTAARLPVSSWMAAMNECDRLVEGRKQFVVGAEISVDVEPLSILEELDKSCNGRTVEIGGYYKTHVGAPPLPVYAFTDEDIVITKGQSYEPFPGLENTYNGIHATYPEPEEAWADKDAPPRYNAEMEASDGNRRLIANAKYPMVPVNVQVQRLMRSAIEDARRFRRHNFFLPPEAWMLEPVVDSVSWSSARNGYVNKLFVIGSMMDHPNCLQEIALQEVDPADYSWRPSDELPSSVGPTGPIVPAPQPMVDWFAEAAVLEDSAGKPRRPAIRLYWDGDQDDVKAVEFEVRLAASLATVHVGRTDQPEVGSIVTSQGLLPVTLYQVRGRYLPFSARETTWSSWLPVTTTDTRLGRDDIYDIDLGWLSEEVKRLNRWIGDETRLFRDRVESLATNASDQDLRNYDDKAMLRREVVVVANNITAAYSEAINVAVGPGSAIASQIETLTVEIATKASVEALNAVTVKVTEVEGVVTAQAASIQQLSVKVDGKASAEAFEALYVEINGDGGLAERVAGVELSFNDASAYARVRQSVNYSPPAGWSARIGMEVRVDAAGTFRSAGMFLDVTASTARVVFNVDQFIITSAGAMAQPFVFAGGVAYIENARIGTVYFNQLMSTNGKLVIRGYGSFADISVFS